MRKVIVKPTGKVDGIAHLFCDVSSGRYFVRYKRGKIDRTATLHGLKSFAFSTLQRAADRKFSGTLRMSFGQKPLRMRDVALTKRLIYSLTKIRLTKSSAKPSWNRLPLPCFGSLVPLSKPPINVTTTGSVK